VVERTIIHQFDPERAAVGGVDTVIRDVVKFSPPTDDWSLVGVQSRAAGRRGIGQWREVDLDGRPVRFLPVEAIDPDDQNRRVPHTARLVAGLLRAGRPRLSGVLHVHRVDLAAALATLYPRSPLVLWIHTSLSGALGSTSDSTWKNLRSVYGGVERTAIRRALSVVTAGRPEFDRVSALHPRCFELPSWYDDDIFGHHPRPDGPDRDPRLVWAGRLEEPKDPNLALDVAAELKRRGTPVTLEVYGTGTLRARLERRIAAESLADVVELRGPVPRRQLAGHIAAADVLLMTSHFEGAPRILVEALGCGTPVAGPAAVDPAGVITSANGRLAPARTAASIADAVTAAAALRRPEVSASVRNSAAGTLVPELLAELEAPAPGFATVTAIRPSEEQPAT
jgi:glycosyltransferase involved in cell wall biosynthesis